jgi:UDP-glucose 4-epimerase
MDKIFNIGLTGPNSFIGKNIVDQLIGIQGIKLFLFTSNSELVKTFHSNTISNLNYIPMDQYLVKKDLFPNNLDCFIHLAWSGTRGDQRNDKLLQSRNFDYSLDLLKILQEKNCKKFISFGSQAEYGTNNGIINEESPLNASTYYGHYKAKLSISLKDKFKIPFIWFRLFSAYGQNDYEHTLIMQLIKSIIALQKSIDLSHCTQNWNYIYSSDIVSILFDAIFNDHTIGFYNLASNDSRPLKSFVQEVKNVMRSNIVLNFGERSLNEPGVSFKPSIIKLLNEFKIEKFTIFSEGVKNILKNLK